MKQILSLHLYQRFARTRKVSARTTRPPLFRKEPLFWVLDWRSIYDSRV